MNQSSFFTIYLRLQMPTLYYSEYSSADTIQQLIINSFTCKEAKLQKISSKHHSPLVLVDRSTILNQTFAISVHLSEGSVLNGKNIEQEIDIYSWLQFYNRELYPIISELNDQIFGKKQANRLKFNYSLEELKKTLKIMDEYLKLRTFFVSNSITLVDIVLCCQLEKTFKMIINQDIRKKLVNLFRWYSYVRNTPQFIKYFGKMFLCQKQFIPAFGSQQQQIRQPQVKEEKKIKSQNIPAKKEQQEKEEEKPNSETESFKLDDFKRAFQNTEEKQSVIDSLLNEFPNGWSIWKIWYNKDVTQGKTDYLTCNLARGTLQRLQSFRKKGFGSWGVYYEQELKEYEIRGVMIWKGEEIAQQWKEHPSYEYHIFTKLDPKSKESEKIIKDYWLSREKAQGLSFYDSYRLV